MTFDRMKKSIAVLLALFLLAPLALCPDVWAEEDSRVVLGADLTEEQVETVYALMGIERGSVVELTVTNAEERHALQGMVDESVIGKNAISCVYVELLPAGAGLDISLSNINWCTAEMYENALLTAGITDAKILVTAPFEVSGTAALTGIYKAYEHITGDSLDESAKELGNRELTVTGELAEQIGNLDATKIVSSLKQILGDTAAMSDEELKKEIESVASRLGVSLTDKQVRQLIDLCRSLESLDPEALTERVNRAQDTVRRIGEAKDKAVGFFETISKVIAAFSDFFRQVRELLGK